MEHLIVDPDSDAAVIIQGEQDWDFVQYQIALAEGARHPLNREFVDVVTEMRLQHALSSYSYPDRLGAGATRDSSRLIVKSIIGIHLVATNLEADSETMKSLFVKLDT